MEILLLPQPRFDPQVAMLIASPPNRFPAFSGTDNHKVAIRLTGRYGLGVFSSAKIREGELIASFDGDVHDGYFQEELPEHVRNHAVQFALRKVRDSKGIARFINHSCNPNCGLRGLFDIVAMRDIEPNMEITWDYDMSDNAEWVMYCDCRERNCRKILCGFRFLPTPFRKRYRGYISDWLADKAEVPPLPLPEITP